MSNITQAVVVSHAPLNPGRRLLPVRSCCMAACLMARFLAISASNAASNPSTSDNASAMARCSGFDRGYGIHKTLKRLICWLSD